MCARPDRQGCGNSCKLRAELEYVDGGSGHIDVRRREAAALRWGARSHGTPLDVQPSDRNRVDAHVALEQRPGRPAQGHTLGAQPDTMLVGELEALEIQCR